MLSGSGRIVRWQLTENKLFMGLSLITVLQALIYTISYFTINRAFPGSYVFNVIINDMLYINNAVFEYLWIIFVYCMMLGNLNKCRKRCIASAIPAVIVIIMSITNLFVPVFFTVDRQTFAYQRLTLYAVPTCITAIYFIYGLIIVFRYKNQNNRYLFFPAITFMIPISIGIIVDTLEKLGVQYNQVAAYKSPLGESKIIELLAGGDRTKGSCASVGLSYVGQKNGLNVLDFRGGESQNFFSNGYNLKKIAELPDITKISEISRSSLTSGKKLLANVEEGNEYYFVCGKHATIVRKNEGILQYLELQSEDRSGWTDFNGNVRYTLAKRFGETKGYDCEAYMFNVQDAKNSKELQVLLGYINTVVDEQRKGVGGTVK